MRVLHQQSFLKEEFERMIPKEIKSHSIAVAKGAEKLAASLKLNPGPVFLAGLFHDIGKSMELVNTGFHPIDGALYLESIGENDLALLVARHSTSVQEAQILGIDLEPWNREEFIKEQAILDAVDLTTNPSGEAVVFSKRLADIENRYDGDSPEVLSLKSLTEIQKEYISLREQDLKKTESRS